MTIQTAASDHAQYSLQCLIIRIREQYPLLDQAEATRAAAKALASMQQQKCWSRVVGSAVRAVRKEATNVGS